MTDLEEQFSQTRISPNLNLSGISVDHLLKWRNIMQKALDEFEEETGHRVSICAVDWTLDFEEPPEEEYDEDDAERMQEEVEGFKTMGTHDRDPQS